MRPSISTSSPARAPLARRTLSDPHGSSAYSQGWISLADSLTCGGRVGRTRLVTSPAAGSGLNARRVGFSLRCGVRTRPFTSCESQACDSCCLLFSCVCGPVLGPCHSRGCLDSAFEPNCSYRCAAQVLRAARVPRGRVPRPASRTSCPRGSSPPTALQLCCPVAPCRAEPLLRTTTSSAVLTRARLLFVNGNVADPAASWVAHASEACQGEYSHSHCGSGSLRSQPLDSGARWSFRH